MRHQDYKEIPCYSVTLDDIKEYYEFVYLFIMDLKRKKGMNVTVRYKAAVRDPRWAATEIVYMALYGYTKKSKFSNSSKYIRWNKAPSSLGKRVLALLGRPGSDYKDELDRKKAEVRSEAGRDSPVDSLSYELRTDNHEIASRMQRYIQDFDLHSSIDLDMLRNLVRTQLIIEKEQDNQLNNRPTSLDLGSLARQVKDYVSVLGLSKKDRIDFGAERTKGSVAELALTFELTLEEYTDLQHNFLIEELEMLIKKHDRRDGEGSRELNSKEFKVWSGGFTVSEARDMLKRKIDDG